MRDSDEFDAKRSELDTAALPNDVDLHLRRVGLGSSSRGAIWTRKATSSVSMGSMVAESPAAEARSH